MIVFRFMTAPKWQFSGLYIVMEWQFSGRLSIKRDQNDYYT